ncbi:flagellar hook assembly protein FlgD [Thermosulfuriphilus sp.]
MEITKTAALNSVSQTTNNQPERVPKKVLDRDDFMMLFITQLQYQDPMNPIQNNEMAQQLALFNQVDQLFGLNQKFEELVSLEKTRSDLGLVSLLGQTVTAWASSVLVEEGKPLGGEIILEEPATSVKLRLLDSEGRLVRSLDLGALPAGEHELSWDGLDDHGNPVADGAYQIRVTALDATGEPVEAKTKTTGRITSVSLSEDGQSLGFNGLETKEIKDIISVIKNRGLEDSL